MSIKRCSRGLHFFDDTKYDQCPHCGMKAKTFEASENNMNDMVTVAQYDVGVSEQVPVYMNNQSMKQFVRMDIDDSRTIAFHSSIKGNDYVTGWLVCILGPEKGRDYRLHHGFNKIGRGYNMDVPILEDMYISKDTHCSIVYEPKSNMFYLTPSMGNLTYMNGNIVQETKTLSSGDVIHIGESEFEFIAFCRGDRRWDKY